MPWDSKTVEQKRTEFVAEMLLGEKSMSQICREYDITRNTGYKWLGRATKGETLCDKEQKSGKRANKTRAEIEEIIINERNRHPTWGARKLKRLLENKGKTGIPSPSTICEILKRNGKITTEDSEKHHAYKRFEKESANDMWQMDFKGDFALLDTRRCYPLTVLDDSTRYAICLEAKENQQWEGVRGSILRVFKEYGLPGSILCDNGAPWGDSKGGITQFDVWMMQLEIQPIHIRPCHPQTQGKEERFHRTLKNDVLKRELFGDIEAAQRRFDIWRDEYNNERPHEAIEFETPSRRYKASKRGIPEIVREPEYDSGVNLRKVNYKGYISINRHRYFMSDSLIGKMLEIRPMARNEVYLYYGRYRVAVIDLDEHLFTSRRIYRRDHQS